MIRTTRASGLRRRGASWGGGIAIGASTGGPKALLKLLWGLAAAPQSRILIVQHIAKGFAAGLAAWLDRESPFAVRLAQTIVQDQASSVIFGMPKAAIALGAAPQTLAQIPPTLLRLLTSCKRPLAEPSV